MVPEYPSSPMIREDHVPGGVCPGLGTVAPWAPEYPEGPLKEVPGESARGCAQRLPSTRFPEDPYKHARERVLGEVNGSP